MLDINLFDTEAGGKTGAGAEVVSAEEMSGGSINDQWGNAEEEMAVTKAAAACLAACFACSLPALPFHKNQLTLTVTHSQSRPSFQCKIRQTSAS